MTSSDPGELTIYVYDLKAHPRKLRLLSCGYCYRIWHLLAFPGSRELLELVDRFADELVEPEPLAAARAEHVALLSDARRDMEGADRYAAEAVAITALRKIETSADGTEVPWLVSNYAAHAAMKAEAPDDGDLASTIELREYRAMCDLIRDIFGNPFRPVTFAPEWRTATATALAHQMYDARDFGAMPILADALQDAGCDSDDILSHCRNPEQVHVRGCWVVDLVLGKH
ncbi:hypothetical protein R5W24_006263 [Gemmata sp. JC717]|uniref:hypothetical protein n=1 Tax=Gemmata algarum TaxID=2975278 RepID=UPI0021BB5100|nr:hypothetical protein [Gemmata algarum]MDY3557078.1 hypothetical protein [Gemmata algarum]